MSLRILLRDHPQRSFALATDTHALVFRHPQSSTGAEALSYSQRSKSSASKCMVEFSTIDGVDLADYRSIRQFGVYGTLGLISINTDVFLCIIDGAARVATVRPGETVQRILSVEFCQLISPVMPSHSCFTDPSRLFEQGRV